MKASVFIATSPDGGKTIQGVLNAGLIEQMTMTTIPVLIGSVIPLFGPTNRIFI